MKQRWYYTRLLLAEKFLLWALTIVPKPSSEATRLARAVKVYYGRVWYKV